MPETPKSKDQMYLVKPKPMAVSRLRSKSIFSVENHQQTKNIQQIDKDQSQINPYQICGDFQFKTKYLQNLSLSRKTYLKNNKAQNTFDSNLNLSNYNNQNRSFIQKIHKKSIYNNEIHTNNFISNLHNSQKNVSTRETSSLKKYLQAQKNWQKVQGYLKSRVPKSQTVTFSSVNKIYTHENPQKDQIINDMLPEYWRNSLRNNNKKLKSYLKGHNFNLQKAEQMLQTVKGTKQIQKSIPKINTQNIKKVLSKNNSLHLRAKKIEMPQGAQTIRQYHKCLYRTLNETLKQRSLKKQKGKKFSQSNRFISPQDQSQAFPLIDKLKQDQKDKYFFCKDLEDLDRIDNEIYEKKYDRKSKWLLQALQIIN